MNVEIVDLEEYAFLRQEADELTHEFLSWNHGTVAGVRPVYPFKLIAPK